MVIMTTLQLAFKALFSKTEKLASNNRTANIFYYVLSLISSHSCWSPVCYKYTHAAKKQTKNKCTHLCQSVPALGFHLPSLHSPPLPHCHGRKSVSKAKQKVKQTWITIIQTHIHRHVPQLTQTNGKGYSLICTLV